MRVLGFKLPDNITPGQKYTVEMQETGEPNERLDYAEVYGSRILLYTSEFIELDPRNMSTHDPVRQLQVMRIYEVWDQNEENGDDGKGFDPYVDYHTNTTYREVMMPIVYRTCEGDIAPTTHDTHADWMK